MQRVILHIDFDSFFASVEQQYNPRLRGWPIGITATNGRACIIAASREAKKLGVRSPSTTYTTKKICPNIQFVSADFVKYWTVSKKFISIAKDYSPYVEVFSIDEVFIDVTQTVHLFKNVDTLIQQIKMHIQKEIGEHITVSVGISHNKLLAKLASGLRKPNGICKITKENLDTIYTEAKLTDICGIGERIRIRLNSIGIYSLLQLRTVRFDLLLREFGPSEAAFLKRVGFAIDDSPIISYTEAPEVKSVGRNYCLPKNEYNKRIVLQNIYELCEEVGIKLRRLDKKAKTVFVSLRGNTTIQGQKTAGLYINNGKDIFEAISNFLPSDFLWSGKDYIRQISIGVSGLIDKKYVPMSLFDSAKQHSLQKAIDTLNEKFGDHTIRNGFLLYADKLTTLPNGFMADKYERTKLAGEGI